MEKETGGPAFPRPAVFTKTHGLASVEQDGMTLRDYFAAKAMEGMLACDIECGPEYVKIIADSAYLIADAMLKERNK